MQRNVHSVFGHVCDMCTNVIHDQVALITDALRRRELILKNELQDAAAQKQSLLIKQFEQFKSFHSSMESLVDRTQYALERAATSPVELLLSSRCPHRC